MQSVKVIQRDRVVRRPSVPHSSEQGLLLSSLHRVLDITAVEALTLGEFRQEEGSVLQRKVDLLFHQEARKELDPGVPVRRCHGHPLLEAIENLWINLVGIARCTKEKDVAVAVPRPLALLGQLSNDLVTESIGGVRHISIRSDHVQAVDKYDRRRAGACALEEELHSVAALAGKIRFEVRESGCEEREPALVGECLRKLPLDAPIGTGQEQVIR